MLFNLLHSIRDKLRNSNNVRQQFFKLLQESEKEKKLDSKILMLLQRSLHLMDLSVEEVMLPKRQMTTLRIDQTLEEVVNTLKQTTHSRYPVYDAQGQKIVGLLLAKDLLAFIGKESETFSLAQLLRPPYHVPLSKRLHHLLTDFQRTHNHLAIVVDEHGHCCGLVTIEDVLEQIVGNIEDEHDSQDDPMIYVHAEGESYSVKGLTQVKEVNEFFNIGLEENEFDTIGGWITHYLGHLPKKGESFKIKNLSITIMRADLRQIQLVKVTPLNSDLNLTQLTQKLLE